MKNTPIAINADREIMAEFFEGARIVARKNNLGLVVAAGYLLAIVRIIEKETGHEIVALDEKEIMKQQTGHEIVALDEKEIMKQQTGNPSDVH